MKKKNIFRPVNIFGLLLIRTFRTYKYLFIFQQCTFFNFHCNTQKEQSVGVTLQEQQSPATVFFHAKSM